jgi:hypothetical protein
MPEMEEIELNGPAACGCAAEAPARVEPAPC